MDKKSTRGNFLGNASQKMLIHCSCRVCYKEKAQNIEHRNCDIWDLPISEYNKEKAQNIEHRNTDTFSSIFLIFLLDKEKAQNIEHRNIEIKKYMERQRLLSNVCQGIGFPIATRNVLPTFLYISSTRNNIAIFTFLTYFSLKCAMR